MTTADSPRKRKTGRIPRATRTNHALVKEAEAQLRRKRVLKKRWLEERETRHRVLLGLGLQLQRLTADLINLLVICPGTTTRNISITSELSAR